MALAVLAAEVGAFALCLGTVLELVQQASCDVGRGATPVEPDVVEARRPVRRIWFERQSFQVVQEDRLTPAGEVEATMQLEDFRPVDVSPTGQPPSSLKSVMADPMVKPFKISMRDGQGQGALWLTFHEIVPNPSLKPEELEPIRS